MATKKPTTKKTPAKPAKKASSKPVKQAKKTAVEKKNPWRPTKYKPEYDEMIIEIMRDGASAVEFCAEIGINRDTIAEWCKNYDSFSVAFTRAKLLCQAWWERQGRSHLIDESNELGSKRFNERLWTRNVACRFRDDWTEKKTVTLETSTEKDKSLLEQLIAKTDGK